MKCLADIWEPVTTFPRRRDRTRTAKFEPKQIKEGGKERRSLKTAIHKRCEAVLSLLTSNLLAACCQAAHIEATRCGCRAGWVLITDEPLRGLKVIESRPPPPGVYVPHQSATAAVLRCPSSPSREEGKKKYFVVSKQSLPSIRESDIAGWKCQSLKSLTAVVFYHKLR